MKKTIDKDKSDALPKAKRSHISQADIPAFSVTRALRVARAIFDNYGNQPTKPLWIAQAMDVSPTTGGFRMITGASVAYGLTDGGYGANVIYLTPLARRILAPTEEGDDLKAKQEATLKPKVISDFLTRYNNAPLPSDMIAQNVLGEMGVPREKTQAVFDLIKESAKEVGFLREIKGKSYVDLQGVAIENDGDKAKKDDEVILDPMPIENKIDGPILTDRPQLQNEKPKPIFIAHGKNKGPLDQLKRILEDLRIPYRVAGDEPNLGKLIPEKVKSLMKECGSAIFIFTGNEGKIFTNKEGQPEPEKQVPNLNVVFELGAASVLYNDRIIIFKEDGVEFASDFNSVGYIPFENGNLQAKSGDLLKELVALGFIKITTAS